MKIKNYIISSIVLAICFNSFGQSALQKKADNLFNNFAFATATDAYQELLKENDNSDYAVRQLADSYAYLRNPDSAVVYYKQAVKQPNVPNIFLYNYAQALRGTKAYKESQVWLKNYKNEGGELKEDIYLKDDEFLNAIFNAKQHYFLKEVHFNSKFSDFGAYEKDDKIYFVSARNEGVLTKNKYGWDEEPLLDIYVTNKSSNDSIYKKLKGKVNTVFHEGPLTISNDGKTMYFSRNDFNNESLGKNTNGVTNLKIYKATLIDDKWTKLEELPFNSNTYSISHPALNKDGSKLYFASDMPGGIGGTDIYYVQIDSNGTYGSPQNLGNLINTNKNESFPFLNSENVLFFSSDGHPGLGLLDVFGTVSDKNSKITSIINLGIPVNSSKDDFSFFMNSDGLSGYFASNRIGGVGSDDIYAYTRMAQLQLEGTVMEVETNAPITDAVVSLMDVKYRPIATVKTDNNGQYEINIDRDTDYILNTAKPNYVNDSKSVSSKGIYEKVTRIKNNISLNRTLPEVIPITELTPIYFDFNKYDIRSDSTIELDRIINLMVKDYPNMEIKIEAHSDSRGTSNYNKTLSEKRAKSTNKYLVKNGVNPVRILDRQGFGEQKLVHECDSAKTCTEEQHQLNRRTQIIVIKMQ